MLDWARLANDGLGRGVRCSIPTPAARCRVVDEMKQECVHVREPTRPTTQQSRHRLQRYYSGRAMHGAQSSARIMGGTPTLVRAARVILKQRQRSVLLQGLLIATRNLICLATIHFDLPRPIGPYLP